MIKYFLEHRIAVVMSFLALVILGIVTYEMLPVSLLPDIPIPHITVEATLDNASARELENTVTTPLRRQLMQTEGLAEIKSETRDGTAIISLTMDYGVDTDLAFIEVNEKIDGAMNYLPKTAERPRAVKASATDIPVMYLQMTPQNDSEESFVEIADVAENIVRRRLEQLPEVAMADITGIPEKSIRITLLSEKAGQAGVTTSDIETALISNNVEPGSMTVKEGYYEYNIHVSNLLQTADDIKKIKIEKGGRLLELGDFADIRLTTRRPMGYSVHDGHRAVTLAIIKHSDESMSHLKDAVGEVTASLQKEYPEIDFSETRDQTALLDYTISNLEQNLILGLILVFLSCLAFMGSARSSAAIGISITASVAITLLLFYLFKVSVNIISMSGMILAVGMMIDNSLIVMENIEQFIKRGEPLKEACAKGTEEVITPMLSSSLTTVAVFVPLIFMSGIAGAIFADQAFAITAGLAASYATAVGLLPVTYYLLERKKFSKKGKKSETSSENTPPQGGIKRRNSHDRFWIAATLLMIPVCIALFPAIKRERMPEITSDEITLHIDWNENISIDENLRRTEEIMKNLDDSAPGMVASRSAYAGPQDFLLGDEGNLSATEAEIYLKTSEPEKNPELQKLASELMVQKYPKALFSVSKSENIFEKIFASDEANIEARIHRNGQDSDETLSILELHDKIGKATGESPAPIPLREQIDIVADMEKLAVYNVDFSEVERTLSTAFRGLEATTLRAYNEYTPIEIAGSQQTADEVIANTFVSSRKDDEGNRADVPLRNLITSGRSTGLRTITAGDAGEYVPMKLDASGHEEKAIAEIRETVDKTDGMEVEFAGNFFSNTKMMNELLVILIVSVMLMYFILCAQFESFVQPLIVLVEIPVDTAFALVTLMIFGQTLNLMSAIGIIVSSGIIVNDSILKIDTINELRKAGMPLDEAIHTGGHRRLRAIVMTSLTTVASMIPVFFSSDMGSDLQRPLAIAMTGEMTIGTLVSIYIVPLFYRAIYRRHEK